MGLTVEGTKKGRKAMEDGMTKAARVRRLLKGGRPRNAGQSISALSALHALVNAADRGRKLMHEAGLSPDDIRFRLVYLKSGKVGFAPLPPPAGAAIAPFFAQIEKLETMVYPKPECCQCKNLLA